jgi:hypothetical protein
LPKSVIMYGTTVAFGGYLEVGDLAPEAAMCDASGKHTTLWIDAYIGAPYMWHPSCANANAWTLSLRAENFGETIDLVFVYIADADAVD